MLLAVSLVAGWVGQALILVGWKNWTGSKGNPSPLSQLLLGNWNPELWTLEAPPTNANPFMPPATRQEPGPVVPPPTTSTPGIS